MRASHSGRRSAAGLTAGALLAMPLGLAAPVSAAAAVRAAQTSSVLRIANPPRISYGARQTTIAGTLTDGTNGLGGEPVSLALYGDDRTTLLADLGTVTTGADGAFSVSTTVPGPGVVRATFAGDDAHAARTALNAVGAQSLLPSRVVFDPAPATVQPDTDFTISGQVQERTPDGSWEPADWARVRRSGNNAYSYAGHDGRFSFTVSEKTPANWQVYVASSLSGWADSSTSKPLFVAVPSHPTRVTSLTVRSNGVAQNGLTITVHADEQADGQWKPYARALDLYFRPKGSSTWQKVTGQDDLPTSNAAGDQVFSGIATPYTRIPSASGNAMDSLVAVDGVWRAEVPPVAAAPGVIGIDGSASGEVPTVRQRFGTAVTNMAMGPTGSVRDLVAELWEPCGDNGYCGMVPKQPVKLYFRYRTGKAWHFVTTARTDGDGELRVRLPHAKRYYRLVYGGSSIYGGTTSRKIYFSG